MLGTREYTLCSSFRANAHNSSFLGDILYHVICYSGIQTTALVMLTLCMSMLKYIYSCTRIIHATIYAQG